MSKLNIKFLIDTSSEDLVKNIDLIFSKLVEEIELYLNLEPVDKKFTVSLENDKSFDLNLQTSAFSIGARRIYDNGVVSVIISSKELEFVPIIALREAYKCFVPKIVSDSKIVDIWIGQKVIIDLKKLKSMVKWDSIIDEKLVDYEFMSEEYDHLEEFLKMESPGRYGSPFQFFFACVRSNPTIILEKQEGFYDMIYRKYRLITSRSLYDDEMLETIRVLKEIFYKVKYYTAMLDYLQYFTIFKENGSIQTDQSLNKFTENMLWIKNYSVISPNYKINWAALNICSINCSINFNPILKRSQLNQFVGELPFFLVAKESKTSFGLELDGYFVIPKQYLRDLKRFLEQFKESGYILHFRWNTFEKGSETLNLNYFREYHDERALVDKDNLLYDKKYELERFLVLGGKEYDYISLLDWLILDRVQYGALNGFTFERNAGTLKNIKEDFKNEELGQRKFVADLKTNLERVHSSSKLKDLFLDFLTKNEEFGFFFVKTTLYKYTSFFDLIKKVLINNPSIDNVFKFREFVKNRGVSSSIKSNLIFLDISIQKYVFNELLPLYFSSKDKFEQVIDRYNQFYKVISSCYDLKIFNLRSVRAITKDKSALDSILETKQRKLEKLYEKNDILEINYHAIEKRLKAYINHDPPAIVPNLISEVWIDKYSQLYFLLFQKDSLTIEKLKEFFHFSKKILIQYGEIIYVAVFLPYLTAEEVTSLISIISNTFEDSFISFKRYLFSGYVQAFSRKDFYDFERKCFFYTPDLFEQFSLNGRHTLGEVTKPLLEVRSATIPKFWSRDEKLSNLIASVEKRVKNEGVDLTTSNLRELVDFNDQLREKIVDLDSFKESQQQSFFQNYIKSINFVPSFQHFGMSQYTLYFYPTDLDKVDFKLLLNNSFQSIRFPAQIDNSNSFLVQYIYPYRNPGVRSYLNWLTRSKKIVREYCLFFVKKFYQILHFDYNLGPDGWDFDSNKFKTYFQHILFDPDYKADIPNLKKFSTGDVNVSSYYGPISLEFDALSHIYNWKSLDIKSYLTRRYLKINASVSELLKKGLIQPYLSLKNLDLVEEVTIILPDVKKEHNESILRIFNFFNVGFIYETEGEYYIHGFDEVVKFENGIVIKLYLPDCRIDEFEELFDLVFQYLQIDHYLVINDLVDGKNLLDSTFNGLKFLEKYNPLTNLIWNDKDKRWRNHKLFDENFEPVYPDLFYGKNKNELK